MQSASIAARIIGVMQQAALIVCIIYKYLHATEQHFACCAKWRRTIRSIAYTSSCNIYAGNFLYELIFGLEHKLCLKYHKLGSLNFYKINHCLTPEVCCYIQPQTMIINRLPIELYQLQEDRQSADVCTKPSAIK
jgi:hypothetical protein